MENFKEMYERDFSKRPLGRQACKARRNKDPNLHHWKLVKWYSYYGFDTWVSLDSKDKWLRFDP